ncbi:MAG: hypothetical protein ACI93R_001057 [Flavobacteriales bacterium]|jgi:hypothetical protein
MKDDAHYDKVKMKEKFKKAVQELKEQGDICDGIDDELIAIDGEPAAYFGPTNDIERRRLIKEIRASEKDD